jgi:ketosteroid isomerase-like protein
VDAERRYERPGYDPLEGLAAVLYFYREVRIVASGRHGLHRILVNGDAVACSGRFTGRSRDNKPLDERFCDVYRVSQARSTVARRTSCVRRSSLRHCCAAGIGE